MTTRGRPASRCHPHLPARGLSMRTTHSSSVTRRTARSLACAVAVLALPACAGHHHLGEYTFAERSMAVVVVSPPAPDLLMGGYNVRADDPVGSVLRAGTVAAKDVEARRAHARLDSAAAIVGATGDLAQRTLERTSRYIGTRPVQNSGNADYLLEVRMKSFG